MNQTCSSSLRRGVSNVLFLKHMFFHANPRVDYYLYFLLANIDPFFHVWIVFLVFDFVGALKPMLVA